MHIESQYRNLSIYREYLELYLKLTTGNLKSFILLYMG